MYKEFEKSNMYSRFEHLILIVIALAFSVILTRGDAGFGSMTFGMLSEANKLSNGANVFDLWPAEPFGYQLILYFISNFIPGNMVDIGYYFNLICFAGTIYFYYFLLKYINIFNRYEVIAVIVAYSFYGQTLFHVSNIWVEAPFTLILMAFFYLLISYQNKEKNIKVFGQLCLLIFLAVTSMYFRYIGIVLVVCAAIYSCYNAIRGKINLIQLFILGLFSVILIAPLIFRNYYVSGVLTGHPLNVMPAYIFKDALMAFLLESSRWLPIPLPNFLFSGNAIITTVWCLLFAFLLINRWDSSDSFALKILRLFSLFYIFVFSIFESITRLDLVNYRFIHPIVPFVFIAFFVHIKKINKYISINKLRVPNLIFVIALLIFVSSCLKIIKGRGVSDFNYSPQTLNHISQALESNAAILTNRFGDQVGIFRDDLKVHLIPFTDKANAGYTEAYGVQVFNQETFNSFVNKNKIIAVVFFMGPNKRDPFLNAGEYGEFVNDYIKNTCYGECQVRDFNDGFVLLLNKK